VQYAWPDALRRYLYVATSSSAPGYGTQGTDHHVTALAIDAASGALTPHGEPIRLPTRPIRISTDIPSEYLLVAFNNPSAVRVYRINEDFRPGEEVKQGAIDAGIFAHQVRTTPDNRLAILVTRGNEATPTKAEDPGALKVFDYKNGLLTNEVSIAPNGGKQFGPRHLDFHPTKPWMYVSIETQNKMYTYLMEGGRINPEIAYRAETLAEPNNISSASGGRHGSRPPEWPVFVRGKPRRGDDRISRQAGVQGRREQHRRLFDQPVDRRADPNPAHRDPKNTPAYLSHRPERTLVGR
jgi:6-phosphogluconolactonase